MIKDIQFNYRFIHQVQTRIWKNVKGKFSSKGKNIRGPVCWCLWQIPIHLMLSSPFKHITTYKKINLIVTKIILIPFIYLFSVFSRFDSWFRTLITFDISLHNSWVQDFQNIVEFSCRFVVLEIKFNAVFHNNIPLSLVGLKLFDVAYTFTSHFGFESF